MSIEEPRADTGSHAQPTLEEVAARAGVSRATVSRAINGGHKVSPAKQKAIDIAVRELGYSPNPAARSLVTRRTDSIAVVVPESDIRVFSDPFFTEVLHGVNEALAETDLQMVLLIRRRGADTGRMARYLRGGHTDGAIVVSHHRDDGLTETLVEASLPTVFVGRPWRTDLEVLYVDVNNHGAGELAVERLIATGRRAIGTITGPRDMTAARDRFDGWRTAMETAGLPVDAVAEGDFTPPGGAAAARRLFDAHPDLDGVFVASDFMAAATVEVLAELGLRVPEDVAVVGFDDFPTSTAPTLTTFTHPVREMASNAANLLITTIRGEPPPEPVVWPTRLVVRTSG